MNKYLQFIYIFIGSMLKTEGDFLLYKYHIFDLLQNFFTFVKMKLECINVSI